MAVVLPAPSPLMREEHVFPTWDTIAHERSDDCWCGPDCIPVESDDGRLIGYVYAHWSVDGRELPDPRSSQV